MVKSKHTIGSACEFLHKNYGINFSDTSKKIEIPKSKHIGLAGHSAVDFLVNFQSYFVVRT